MLLDKQSENELFYSVTLLKNRLHQYGTVISEESKKWLNLVLSANSNIKLFDLLIRQLEGNGIDHYPTKFLYESYRKSIVSPIPLSDSDSFKKIIYLISDQLVSSNDISTKSMKDDIEFFHQMELPHLSYRAISSLFELMNFYNLLETNAIRHFSIGTYNLEDTSIFIFEKRKGKTIFEAYAYSTTASPYIIKRKYKVDKTDTIYIQKIIEKHMPSIIKN